MANSDFLTNLSNTLHPDKVAKSRLPAGADPRNYDRVQDVNAHKAALLDLRDHTSGHVNVKSYGATGDGTTDDTAALQAAIGASYGKRLLIPRGDYKFTGPLTIQPIYGGTSQLPMEILGEGFDANGGSGGTILRNVGSGDAIQIVNGTGQNADALLTLRGFSLLGDGTNASGGHGIRAERANGLNLRDLWISGHRESGIYLKDCWTSTIDGATVLSNRRHGIYVDGRFNAGVIRRVKAYYNGRVYDASHANILFTGSAGLESLGARLEQVDVSYAGGAAFSSWTRAGGTLVSIVVAGAVTTVTTSTAHGLSIGNKFTVNGATVAPTLNVQYTYTVATTPTGTTFTFTTPSGAGNGTYTESTLKVQPSAFGMLLSAARGLVIANGYAEDTSDNAIYAGDVQGLELTGGYYQDALVNLDAVQKGRVSGARFVGTGGGLAIGASDVEVSDSNSFESGSRRLGTFAVAGTVNVKTYGAKGDGATDDTSAFQAALDAANTAGGGTVLIPLGTFIVKPVSNTSWLKVYSNTTIAGVGAGAIVKVADSTGDYLKVFGNPTGTTVKHVTFRDFRIDQNAAGNMSVSVIPNVATAGQFAVHFNAFEDLTVTSMTFDDSTGINTVVATDSTSVGGVTVTKNTFVFEKARSLITSNAGQTSRAGSTVTVTSSAAHLQTVGDRIYLPSTGDANFPVGSKTIDSVADATHFTYTEAGSAVASSSSLTFSGTYDNSAIYIDAPNYTVVDNKFSRGSLTETKISTARTAIEVHSGPGIVTDNTVSGYVAGVHVVSAAGGAANAPTDLNVVVGNNTLLGVNMGIDVRAITGTTTKGVTFTGNVVNVANADYGRPNAQGISLYFDTAAAGSLENITMANNVITMQSEVRAGVDYANSAGIFARAKAPVVNLSIVNNTVRGAPCQGLRLESTHANGIVGAHVAGNVLVDAGNNTSSALRAAFVTSGLITQSTITGTKIIDTGSPSLNGQYGWYMANTGASSIHFDRDSNVIHRLSATDLATVMTGTGLFSSRVTTLTYGTQTLKSQQGRRLVLDGNSASALTISAPADGVPGQRLTLTIRNSRGGGSALGALTLSGFKIAATAWAQPADGFSRSIEWEYDATSAGWVELWRSPADVAN